MVQRSYGYDAVVVFDARFSPLVSTSADVPVEFWATRWTELRATATREIVRQFVHEPRRGLCLDFLGLVRDEAGLVIGAVLTRHEAGQGLLADLQRWPVSSTSAEVLLAQIDGDRVRILTEPRHRRGTAFRREVPITPDSEIVGVRGLFEPSGTVLRGLDVRGVPVIAVTQRVPDSDLVFSAKMDRAEALLHARDQLLQAGLVVIVGLGLAGTSVRSLWRQRQRSLLARAQEAETSRQELAERLGVFMRQANDAILLFDPEQCIVEANPRALQLYSYSLPELLQLRAPDLRVAADRAHVERNFADALRDGLIFQTVHQRKNGEAFPVEVSARAVQLGNRQFMLSIIRDISERQAHEREIERLNRLYLLTSRILEVIVHSHTREDLFREVCALLVQLGGTRLAWVGLHVPETATIKPVALCGQDGATDYVTDLRITTAATVAEGRGPTGTAFRQGRTLLCNDIVNDPIMRPWRDRAVAHGMHSAIALPLRCEGECVGVLSVYSAEKNFFSPKQVELLERAVENVSFALAVFARDERRRAAEGELRKLSLAVEQNPCSIVITDLDGAIEYVNAHFTRVTGYTLDEVRGRNPRILKSDLTPPQTYVDMWDAVTHGRPWRGELTNRKKDGSLHTEMIIITAVTDAAGRPTHYIALKEDISERKRAEAELRKLSRAVEQAPLSIVITDLTGAIEYVNPWFTRLTGYTLDEARGRNPRILKSGETPAHVYTDMWATLSRGETWRGELLNRKKDGEVYCEAAVIAPIAGADGVATHYVAIKEDITDRKRAEAALRESEERFRDLFDLESDTILLLETDSGRILQANQAASELYGYSVEELLTMRNVDLSAEPDKTLETARAGTGQPDSVVQVPTRLHRKRDGTVFPVDMNLRFFQRGGQPYYLAAIRDVTERLRAEEALHELVKQLRALHAVSTALQQPNLPVDGILQAIAPHLLSALRSPRDAMVRLYVDAATLRVGEMGETIERFAAPVLVNGRSAGSLEIGYVRRPPDREGTLIDPRECETIESVAHTLGLGLGARESFSAVQKFNAELEQRVTLRTEELAARNREMRALLQSIPDRVVRARRDGTIVHSQGGEDGVHTPAEPAEALRPDLRAALTAIGLRALAAGSVVVEEFNSAATTERSAAVLELRAAPVADDEFVVFIRDITQRKHIEAETVAMLKRERQVSEMKTRFISVTSHEFRTPMAAALGSAELLRNHLDRLTPAKREELFTRMGDAMHRMTEMLDDILTLSRVDAGRVRSQPVAMNLVRFAQEVLDEVRLGDRDAHRFEFNVEGTGEEITSDPSLLRQILSNLLTNAARYSPAGSTVNTIVRLRAQGAEIEVRDQGIGIPSEDLGRIFDAFERGSNVGNIKGTGLGLNIVKRMTELLGGSVSVQSAPQAGSRFTVSLPHDFPTTP